MPYYSHSIVALSIKTGHIAQPQRDITSSFLLAQFLVIKCGDSLGDLDSHICFGTTGLIHPCSQREITLLCKCLLCWGFFSRNEQYTCFRRSIKSTVINNSYAMFRLDKSHPKNCVQGQNNALAIYMLGLSIRLIAKQSSVHYPINPINVFHQCK